MMIFKRKKSLFTTIDQLKILQINKGKILNISPDFPLKLYFRIIKYLISGSSLYYRMPDKVQEEL